MKIYYAYIKRVITSLLFWLAVTGVSVITYFGMTEEKPFTVISGFDIMLDLSTYRKLMMLFATLPFGMTYCREWKNKYASFIASRTTVKNHLKAYIIMQFATSFIVTFIGIWISILILWQKLPLHINDGNIYTGCFDALVTQNKPILYLLFRSLHYSVSIAAWSMSGLAMSSVFTDSYLAVISPLVFSYGLEFITIESSFLPDLWHLSLSYTDFSSNPILSSVYIIGVFLLISLMFSVVFYKIAKRRAENEIH